MIVANRAYGHLLTDKPDNVIQMMYTNFSNLSLFIDGPKKHMKIRQLSKITSDYSVDVLAGCETRTDWHFVNEEASRFTNLFGDGQPTRGLFAHNTNNPKIKLDQWGGDLYYSIGMFLFLCYRIRSRFFWTRVLVVALHWRRGGKTQLIISYQPCNPGKKMQGKTIWDQQLRYFESRGKIRNPRLMFKADLLNLLWKWKAAGDEVL
jgi:hypothetical protein